MLRRILTMFAVLVLSAPSASAQPSQVNGIQIVERGVYRAETVKRTDSPGSTGVVNTVQNVRLISGTNTVFGQVGVRFGLLYVPLGNTPGANVHLKLVITFPPGGLRNPETRQIFFRTESLLTVPIGSTMYWEYHLENEWEIAPGVWTFSFWHQERKLAEQRFCILSLKTQEARAGHSNECTTGSLG